MGFYKDLEIELLDLLWQEEEEIKARQLRLSSEIENAQSNVCAISLPINSENKITGLQLI